MKINTSRKAGFTLVEIMIVVAIIGLLAAIAIPNFVKARETSQINACINNLRQIDSAVQQWALEKGKTTGDAVTEGDVSPYIGRAANAADLATAKCICPTGGKYTPGSKAAGTVGTAPICDDNGGKHKLP
jgi:prepilin-type N-terminal cleavage/methylation domain-containing protein